MIPNRQLLAGTFAALVCWSHLPGMGFCDEADSSSKPAVITFNEHIAPIIHAKCSGCHRPGQAGPFNLITFEDVAKHALTMDAVIDSNYMPPWKPVNQNVAFARDRRLTESQKSLIKRWIASGKLKGSGPEPALPIDSADWALGPPDMVVKMNGKFNVPAAGPDIYRSFVFPLQLSEDKWIKAIDYRPAAKQSVHHALFFADQQGTARQLDGKDGQPGIEGMGFLGAASQASAPPAGNAPSGLFSGLQLGRPQQDIAQRLAQGLGGYAPGNTPAKLPGDLAMPLPKGSDIVMQTHFHPSGKPEVEQGEIALYFADKKPSRTLIPIQVPAMFGVGEGIRVPAGERNYRVTDTYELPIDVQLISIGAHAHYICREAKMSARLPDGSMVTLLQIDDWDLDWQDRYYFEETLKLPAGSTLTTELVYDNSDDNPENPNVPPVEIRWGRESGDEMGSATVMVIPVDESELSALTQSLRTYFMASITKGDIVDLLMQLDTNRDGGLQKSEAPARMASRFRLLDRNRNDRLEPQELEFLRSLMPSR